MINSGFVSANGNLMYNLRSALVASTTFSTTTTESSAVSVAWYVFKNILKYEMVQGFGVNDAINSSFFLVSKFPSTQPFRVELHVYNGFLFKQSADA